MRNKINFRKISSFLKSQNIFKKKHIPFFISIFILTAAIFVPAQNVYACSFWEVGCKIKEAATGALLDLVSGILYLLGAAALYLFSYLVSFGAWLIDVMLEPGIYRAVLKVSDPNSPVMVGWATVRDMSNMLFVFILLLIAFSTILRIQQYSARSLLGKFIMALFLINFSAVIAGLVIDFGQIFMYEMRSWMGTFSGNNGSGGDLTSIVDVTLRNQYPFWSPPAGGYSLENAMGAIFAAVFAFVLAMVYIMLSAFLLFRVIMFAFLIVLAPLAFLGIVMPGLGSESRKWWSKLFSYSLFGPIFMFFVYLSASMASAVKGYPIATAQPELGGLSFFAGLIIEFAIPLGMLLLVIPVTRQLGMYGADKIIGGTMGIGTVAMGTYAGIKLAGAGASRIGSEAAKRNETIGRMQDWARGKKHDILRNVPLGKGQVLKEQAEREKDKEDKMKKMEVQFGDLKNIDLRLLEEKANGRFGTATTEDKALLVKAAAAQGKLGERDTNGDLKYAQYMPAAERALSKKDLESVTNKNLELATMTGANAKRIDKADDTTGMDEDTKIKFGAASTTEKKEMIKEQIMKDKMADLIRDGKAHEVQGLDDKLSAKIWHSSQTSDQRGSSMNKMAKDQRSELAKGYMENTFKTDAEFNSATEEQQRKDIDYRVNAVKLGKTLEEAFKRGGRPIEQDIATAFSRLNPRDISKLDTTDLEKYGKYANTSQIKSLNRSGEYIAIDAIKKSKQGRLSEGIKMGAIGGIKTPVDYDKAKRDLATAKENLEREKQIGGDPARIDRLKKSVDSLEKNLKPLQDIEKDIESIDDSLMGKQY